MRPRNACGSVLFVVPSGLSEVVPSGGIVYDLRVRTGLAELGWDVQWLAAPGSWPHPAPADLDALARRLAQAPAATLVLVDGLVGSAAADVLLAEAGRLRLVHLVHLPFDNPRERSLLAAATVVTTSAWTRRWLITDYALSAGRLYVAEPGADRAEVVAGSVGGDRLLCVGAVTPAKGHDALLDALVEIADLDWRCTIVGALDRAPTFVDRVRRKAREAGITDRVVFAGPRRHTEMPAAYAEADALVLASRAETYGMVVTEALAHGLPVIAHAVGGVPEALGHGELGRRPGLLLPPGERAALSGALRRWLEDPGLRRGLRRTAGRRRLMLPTWSQTAARVAAVLEAAR